MINSLIILTCISLVDDPDSVPKRDYNDYTKFINDTYLNEKEKLMNQTFSEMHKAGRTPSKDYSPLETLRSPSTQPTKNIF